MQHLAPNPSPLANQQQTSLTFTPTSPQSCACCHCVCYHHCRRLLIEYKTGKERRKDMSNWSKMKINHTTPCSKTIAMKVRQSLRSRHQLSSSKQESRSPHPRHHHPAARPPAPATRLTIASHGRSRHPISPHPSYPTPWHHLCR